jgi:hypothetical protein
MGRYTSADEFCKSSCETPMGGENSSSKSEGCDWCKNNVCATCERFYREWEESCVTNPLEEPCISYKPFHYCPNCGARMDAERSEQ